MKDVAVKRWVLEGTDYVYPRTTNKILEAYLLAKGVKAEDISINYTPFGHSDWQTRVAAIKKFGSAGKKTAVVSTINGDANVPFYKELGNQKVSAEDIPVVAFSVGEEELSGLDTKPLLGHLAAWNYFQSIKHAGEQDVHRSVAGLHQESEAHHQRSDGSALHWLQSLGEGRDRRPEPSTSRKCSRRFLVLKRRTSPVERQRCCRIITSPSRSISVKCRRTASSTSFGNPRPERFPAMPGRTFCRAARTSTRTG